MSNIIKFRRKAGSASILLLEIFEEDAGEMDAVMVCGLTKDGLLFFHWHDGGHWAELLASVECAKHALLVEADEQ